MPHDLALAAPQFQRVVQGVASLGAHLHARGVSHGDLYAHNTRVDAQGHALVGDFGAASVLAGLDDEVRAGVERMEVRALGALVDDLLKCGAPAAFTEVRDACWSANPPRFSALAR